MYSSCSIVLLCGLVVVIAAPQEPKPSAVTPIPIVEQHEEFDDKGGYKYSFRSGNGIEVEGSSYTKVVPFRRTAENAELKNLPENEEILVITGRYSYTAPDGTLISLRYIADENGFQPVGDHLPANLPISNGFARIAAKPEVEAVGQASVTSSVKVEPEEKNVETVSEEIPAEIEIKEEKEVTEVKEVTEKEEKEVKEEKVEEKEEKQVDKEEKEQMEVAVVEEQVEDDSK